MKPFFFGGLLGVAFLTAVAAFWAVENHLARTSRPSSESLAFSFAETVKKSAPSVVTVYARRVVRRRTPLWRNPFFEHFFRGLPRGFGIPRDRIERALGSGVVLGEDGIVVTNYHVVRDSEALTVALNDRREFRADLILSDEGSDLAVLKIDFQSGKGNGAKAAGGSLSVLPFGDSDALETGDIVLAIGNPFGLGQTVTNGIISAPARARPGISNIGFFLQTDAAINVGNSGGALVTLDGRLAGINTAIYSQTGGSVGIGFAIPANLVRRVVEAAEKGEPLRRLWIGADFQSVTADIAEAMALESPSGVLITKIYPDSPASLAGLQVGDVVRKFGLHDAPDLFALKYRIETSREDSVVEIEYAREGRARRAEVRVAALPETVPKDERDLSGAHILNGVTVANLSPALAGALNMDYGAAGVVVLSVKTGSPAARLIAARDIIREAGDMAVADVAALAAIFQGANPPRRLVLERGGRRVVVAVR